MAIKINQNVFSALIQRNLGKASEQLGLSLERLGSGQRVNRSADDPVAMARSEQLRFRVQGLRQNQHNVGGAVGLIGTAETHVTGMIEIAQRLRELAVQAANDTLSQDNRVTIAKEMAQMLEEIESTATRASFSGRLLFDGGFNEVAIQTGSGAADVISLSLEDLRPASLGAGGGGTPLGEIDVSSHEAASAAIGTIDAALEQLGAVRSRLGALQNRLETISQGLGQQVQDLLETDSRIRDTDFAFETARMTQQQILQEASVAMLGQANVAPRRALELLRR